MRIDICLLNMVLLTAGMTVGCGSESPSRAAFREVILGSPITRPQLSTYQQQCASELLWLSTREGNVVSKVWGRADFAGVGHELPDEPATMASVPFIVLEQQPWLITCRFEYYGLKDAYPSGAWKSEPANMLAALFPHADSVLSGEVIRELFIHVSRDDSTVVIEDGANRLWLEVRQLKDYTHIRGYLCAVWLTPWPSKYPLLYDLFGDDISPLANLAGWCWYQAHAPTNRPTEGLLGKYRRFRANMLNASAFFDRSRTRAERRVRPSATYKPAAQHWDSRFFSGALELAQ